MSPRVSLTAFDSYRLYGGRARQGKRQVLANCRERNVEDEEWGARSIYRMAMIFLNLCSCCLKRVISLCKMQCSDEGEIIFHKSWWPLRKAIMSFLFCIGCSFVVAKIIHTSGRIRLKVILNIPICFFLMTEKSYRWPLNLINTWRRDFKIRAMARRPSKCSRNIKQAG